MTLTLAAAVLAEFPVEQFLEHWWVFPVSVLFSMSALSSGVSGALFFSPFFMLVVGLSASQAIGAGLMTEVFGMGNGLLNYVRQRVVDYATAKWLLVGAVPTVVVGAFAAHYVPTTLLTILFGVGLLGLGGFLVIYDPPEKCVPGEGEEKYLKKTRGEVRPPSKRPMAKRTHTTSVGGAPVSRWRVLVDSSLASSALGFPR
ncbi:sulfite exporter TauE/SafE family protein [Haloferax chudinovii]|mgnify:CR=1 FL=1|uniref:Probable membrane transporter protein n=1 Tax=Haloferax chudinovii TaxID=1109010 RepID=A0ABD5XIX6_9EURY